MSLKRSLDKDKPGFPWTARQKRRLLGGRTARKQARPAKKYIAARRQRKSAPRRK